MRLLLRIPITIFVKHAVPDKEGASSQGRAEKSSGLECRELPCSSNQIIGAPLQLGSSNRR